MAMKMDKVHLVNLFSIQISKLITIYVAALFIEI